MEPPPRRSSGIVRLPHCSVPSDMAPLTARVDPRSPTGGPCDLDAPPPELVADDRGATALVVGYRDCQPRDDARRRTDRRPGRCRAGDRSPRRGSRRCARRTSDGPHARLVRRADRLDRAHVRGTGRRAAVRLRRGLDDRDAPADIARLLDHLAALDYPVLRGRRRRQPCRGPARGPAARTARGHDVRLVVERRPGCSGRTERRCRAATGEVVAFTDDDVRRRPAVAPDDRNPVRPGTRAGRGHGHDPAGRARDPRADLVRGVLRRVQRRAHLRPAEPWCPRTLPGPCGTHGSPPWRPTARPSAVPGVRRGRVRCRCELGGASERVRPRRRVRPGARCRRPRTRRRGPRDVHRRPVARWADRRRAARGRAPPAPARTWPDCTRSCTRTGWLHGAALRTRVGGPSAPGGPGGLAPPAAGRWSAGCSADSSDVGAPRRRP